jgi:hypothetical protein
MTVISVSHLRLGAGAVKARSLPELSLSAFFERRRSSVYEALQDGRINTERLHAVFVQALIESQPEDSPIWLGIDSSGMEPLVGIRPKQILTLLGPITIKRAYDHCASKEPSSDVPSCCRQGETPADALWGIQQLRTSAGTRPDALCAPAAHCTVRP